MWTGGFFAVRKLELDPLFLGFGLSGEQGREAIQNGTERDLPLKKRRLDLLRGNLTPEEDGYGLSNPTRGFQPSVLIY
jgi:hypothetical protein